ncbi:MAG: hypothetical protein ACRBBQ_13510 [Cognatishimia sp.]
MRRICLVLLLLSPAATQAGPWLRPANHGFMSVRSALAWPSDALHATQSSSLYAEYGVTDATTITLKVDLVDRQNLSFFVSAKRAFKPFENGWITGYTLGIGQTSQGTQRPTTVQAGLSIGKGIKAFENDGWLSLDTDIFLYDAPLPVGAKIVGTAGVSLKNNTKIMLQLSAESHGGQDWSFGIEPSVAIPIVDRQHLKIGVSKQSYGGGTLGASLEYWRAF